MGKGFVAEAKVVVYDFFITYGCVFVIIGFFSFFKGSLNMDCLMFLVLWLPLLEPERTGRADRRPETPGYFAK